MTTLFSKARSNYVHIADINGLIASLRPFPQIRIVADPTNTTLMCFMVRDSDQNGWPTMSEDEDGHETEFDVTKHICPFLEQDQVMIMMEVGYEEQRAPSGFAVAYNQTGQRCSVNLQSIYAAAAQTFKVPVQSISRCEF